MKIFIIPLAVSCVVLAGCADRYRYQDGSAGYEQRNTVYEQSQSDSARADNTFRRTQSK